MPYDKRLDIKYTDSLFYDIFLTGKYIKKMGEQLFRKLNFELTSEEFSTLDFLYENNNICQRDLALKMLINRANMGKILGGLEKKGFIERKLSTKGNYPVKTVYLTDMGKKNYKEIIEKLRKFGKIAIDEITEDETFLMRDKLRKIRYILDNILEIDI